jgi:hypothetical protein
MVDVLQRKCAHEGCGRNPFFNAPGETKGLYCVRHKAPEMVNVLTKRCEHEGCLRQPSFNFEGLSGGVRCLKHRLPTMQNVVSQRCEYNGCGVLFPGFNFMLPKRRFFLVSIGGSCSPVQKRPLDPLQESCNKA